MEGFFMEGVVCVKVERWGRVAFCGWEFGGVMVRDKGGEVVGMRLQEGSEVFWKEFGSSLWLVQQGSGMLVRGGYFGGEDGFWVFS